MNIWQDVDTAITVPINLMPLIDDTDFKTREVAIAYNAAGMDLVWNFQTTAGVTSQMAVTPTTAGDYDWTHSGDGMYKIEIPASGGVSINNDTEGSGWFSGICDGVLAWRGPVMGFRAASLNNTLINDGATTETRLAELDAANLPADIANIQSFNQTLFSLIESQRGSHTGVDEMIFWDPVAGNDLNSGLIFNEPKLTYNFNGAGGVHSLLTANAHQIILGIPNQSGGPTIVNEYVEIDKAYTFKRAPGRDWLYEATHNEDCVIKVSAEGVELSGFRVKTKPTGSQNGICTSGDFTSLRKLWVDFSRGSGIVFDNSSSNILDDFLVQDAAQGGSGHAVHVVGDTLVTERNIIKSGRIFSNGNGGGGADGIRVDGPYCRHNFVTGGDDGLYIHNNTGYGIQEVNEANETIIAGPTIHIGHNTLGDVKLIGAESTATNYQQWASASVCTEGRLSELDADNLPADIAAIDAAIDSLNDLSLGDITGAIQNGVFTRIAVTGDAIPIVENNFKTIQIDAGPEWNMTGKFVYFVISKQNSSNDPIVNRVVDRITDAINGIAEIDLLVTETTPKGCYDYQVEFRNDPADDEAETVMEGTIEITENLRS